MGRSKQHLRKVNLDRYIILFYYIFRYIHNFITFIIS